MYLLLLTFRWRCVVLLTSIRIFLVLVIIKICIHHQTLTIKIPVETFQVTYNFTPEAGDIVSESERYYEISSVNRVVTTIPSGTPGGIPSQTVMYVLSAYLTRTSKLNLIKYSS